MIYGSARIVRQRALRPPWASGRVGGRHRKTAYERRDAAQVLTRGGRGHVLPTTIGAAWRAHAGCYRSEAAGGVLLSPDGDSRGFWRPPGGPLEASTAGQHERTETAPLGAHGCSRGAFDVE